ncbi:hypothetical protein EVAR_89178_1 [Eumeta japonica]|uniref:Uncharacterized protein n=1 Tax=Eumeta variegata TaxID=151549 RepID=A0A4C1YBY3_EUMVA|nr:hypothetical protein EVAR_89178_1 [Eumeta japonica]
MSQPRLRRLVAIVRGLRIDPRHVCSCKLYHSITFYFYPPRGEVLRISKQREVHEPRRYNHRTLHMMYEGRLISPRPKESAPSYTMVKNGLAYFNKDESCEDDPRPGRPVTVVTEENVRKIEKLVLADRRIKLADS